MYPPAIRQPFEFLRNATISMPPSFLPTPRTSSPLPTSYTVPYLIHHSSLICTRCCLPVPCVIPFLCTSRRLPVITQCFGLPEENPVAVPGHLSIPGRLATDTLRSCFHRMVMCPKTISEVPTGRTSPRLLVTDARSRLLVSTTLCDSGYFRPILTDRGILNECAGWLETSFT